MPLMRETGYGQNLTGLCRGIGGKRMEGISLSTATGNIIQELREEYRIGEKKARLLLASCLMRNLVQEEIYNMADYIMEQEKRG